VKPFACEHCGRTFTRKDAVAKHQRQSGSAGAAGCLGASSGHRRRRAKDSGDEESSEEDYSASDEERTYFGRDSSGDVQSHARSGTLAASSLFSASGAGSLELPLPKPEQILDIVDLFSETYDPILPLLHYPTFIADWLTGHADPLLILVVTWGSFTVAEKLEDKRGLISSVLGQSGPPIVDYGNAVMKILGERVTMAMDREALSDASTEVLLRALQSSLLATMTWTRTGAIERAMSSHDMTLSLHDRLRFHCPASPAQVSYRSPGVDLRTWIRGEEHSRACIMGINADTALAGLRDGHQKLKTDDFRGVSLPCSELAFLALPGAIDASVEHFFFRTTPGLPAPCERFSFRGASGFGRASDPVHMYALPDSLSGLQLIPVSIHESILWMEYPHGSPERQRGLALGPGRYLFAGAIACGTMTGEISRRTMSCCQFFTQHELQIHNPEFERPGWTTSGDSARDALLFEARAKKREIMDMHQDFAEYLPAELKSLDLAGDGQAIITLGNMYWGPIVGYAMLHQLLYMHCNAVVVTSPSNWVSNLMTPDETWIGSPNFVIASTHAIIISKLIWSMYGACVDKPLELQHKFDASILQPVLRAGMVHVYTLAKLKTAYVSLAVEISPELYKELVKDVFSCLEGLAEVAGHWETARVAMAVFRQVLDRGDGPTAQELEKLRLLL